MDSAIDRSKSRTNAYKYLDSLQLIVELLIDARDYCCKYEHQLILWCTRQINEWRLDCESFLLSDVNDELSTMFSVFSKKQNYRKFIDERVRFVVDKFFIQPFKILFQIIQQSVVYLVKNFLYTYCRDVYNYFDSTVFVFRKILGDQSISNVYTSNRFLRQTTCFNTATLLSENNERYDRIKAVAGYDPKQLQNDTVVGINGYTWSTFSSTLKKLFGDISVSIINANDCIVVSLSANEVSSRSIELVNETAKNYVSFAYLLARQKSITLNKQITSNEVISSLGKYEPFYSYTTKYSSRIKVSLSDVIEISSLLMKQLRVNENGKKKFRSAYENIVPFIPTRNLSLSLWKYMYPLIPAMSIAIICRLENVYQSAFAPKTIYRKLLIFSAFVIYNLIAAKRTRNSNVTDTDTLLAESLENIDGENIQKHLHFLQGFRDKNWEHWVVVNSGGSQEDLKCNVRPDGNLLRKISYFYALF